MNGVINQTAVKDTETRDETFKKEAFRIILGYHHITSTSHPSINTHPSPLPRARQILPRRRAVFTPDPLFFDIHHLIRLVRFQVHLDILVGRRAICGITVERVFCRGQLERLGVLVGRRWVTYLDIGLGIHLDCSLLSDSTAT
jgi:hypothetical protein